MVRIFLYYFLNKIFSVLEAGGGAPDGDLIEARIGSKQVQMLGEDLKWEMVNTQVPIEMHGHCAVQINDCEIALIGGITGLGTAAGPSAKIYIYNYKSNEWRERDAPMGGDPPEPILLYGHSCVKVMEKTTDATKILFGYSEEGPSTLWEWELSSDRINVVWSKPQIPPARFKKVDENTIVSVHLNGFVTHSTASTDDFIKIQNDGVADGLISRPLGMPTDFDLFLLPRKETKCLPPILPPDGNGGESGENGGGQSNEDGNGLSNNDK